ncbi:MAG: GNAT family N-acetyltransferase [Desulfovibrionaceae bacterium]|jgi:ribosomal protein S18 acetylase RimI-like enzyme|nr:GNAT family N-acetyltransferase [Desulfovibrionaceae bacterium]
MRIETILHDRKRFLDLLLLGDEQEERIDGYLERGELFVLYDAGDDAPRTVCVVTDEGGGTRELKNLATDERYRRRGYGRAMVAFVLERYRGACSRMLVGTGDVPRAIGFYERCGFSRSHRVPGFFVEHYDHPMWEDGVRLVDMVYLEKRL